MGLDPGPISTKRDKYADMWFANLPEPVLISIMTDGVPVDGAVHELMPMEQNAHQNANAIIRASGIGTIPTPATCPSKLFSTRAHRGCVCGTGTKKQYQGLFSEEAVCK